MSDYYESSADYYGDYDGHTYEGFCSVCGGPVYSASRVDDDAMCSDCKTEETGEIPW